jgi:CBS domain-containing protein
MKVKEIMTKEIISVDKDVDLNYVLILMKKHSITKIPVIEEKKLVGIITDNIIAFKLGSIRSRGVSPARFHASSVTDKKIEKISPDTKVKDILKKVGEPGPTMLAVVENDNLVGIVTKADLLHMVNSKKRIQEVMNKKLHSVSPDDRIIHARRILIDENIARLPVIENGQLVGMISDTEIAYILADIKKSISIGRQKHKLDELIVGDVMKTPAIWCRKDITVEEAAKILLKNNIGALPIVDDKKIIGIVTRTDLLKTISI